MNHLLAIVMALLPSAVFAEQFTPQQMLDVITKSPSNRDVRVGDHAINARAIRPTVGNVIRTKPGSPTEPY